MAGAGQGTAVLCSGGLDSVVLLAHEAREREVVPIYVSAGLAWEALERRALADVIAHMPVGRIRPIVTLDFWVTDLYPGTHWAIRGRPPAYNSPDEDVYLIGRNIILLAKTSIYCATRGIGRIVLAPLAGNPFPDATRSFFEAVARAFSAGLAAPLTIEAPFAALTKQEVVRMGLALGVPLERTLSCMSPMEAGHCGRCSKCRERRDAFSKAGVVDPTRYGSEGTR
jgi:7-cyano-7-deazaguanine synthase